MKIDIEKNKRYYENYSPCNCGDCRFFIKHIENEQPELCAYLRTLGVDPLKPYELMSIYHEKTRQIEYFDCAYLVIGKIKNDIEKVINGIKVITCSKDKYPLENIDDDYFLVTFGPIVMKRLFVTNRHFTFEEKVTIIKKVIDEIDPIGLLKMHCPNDEYISEAKLIASSLKNKKTCFVNAKLVQDVFNKQFDKVVSLKICNDIAKKINASFNEKDYIRDFEENESLKGKVSIKDYEVNLKIHDNFVVKSTFESTYINDKFYDNIEEQDLIDYLSDFVENNNIIYVQYKHKHFKLSFSHPFKYFKLIKRDKFSYQKLKHKNDIELIFDNKGVIYSSSGSEDNIIEMMVNEPVKGKYERLFYSPDKKRRLIISQNSAGSYSYYIERLTVLDTDERVMFGPHAFWEPDYGYGNTSFYENIDSLLNDIKVIIKDWNEIK